MSTTIQLLQDMKEACKAGIIAAQFAGEEFRAVEKLLSGLITRINDEIAMLKLETIREEGK